jgi:hypothetical protein
MSKAKQNWLGTQEWSQAEDGYIYENSFNVDAPNRVLEP